MKHSIQFSGKSKSVVFLSFCLFVALLKLSVVSTNEIIALSNDSAVFVRHVLAGVGQLGAPPGYPFWLWFTGLFGFPQRVSIEIFYLFSAFTIVVLLVKNLNKAWASVLYLILAFNPVTYHLFDNALSEPFFICLELIAIGASIGLFRNLFIPSGHAWKWAVLLGSVLGLMSITRNEDMLLMGWVIIFYIFSTLFLSNGSFKLNRVKEIFLLFLITLSLLVVIGESPSAFHFFTKGVWTKTLASMPSHLRLLKNLAKIDIGEKQIKYISISKNARLAAYEVSPTLRMLKDKIETPENMYVEASSRVGLLPLGEVGNGWIWHVFNDAALRTIPEPKTLKSLDDFWLKASEEIEAAFASGRLRERFILHPFLAAGFFSPFQGIFNGFFSAVDKSFHFYPLQVDEGYIPDVFDRVCNRRAALVSDGILSNFKMQGWIFSDRKSDRILAVQIGFFNTERGIFEWVDVDRKSRPDVDLAFSKELGTGISSYGYDANLNHKQKSAVSIRYLTTSGTFTEKNIESNSIKKIKTESDSILYRGMDFFESNRLSTPQSDGAIFQNRVLSYDGWNLIKIILITFNSVLLIIVLVMRYKKILDQAIVPSFVGIFVMGIIFMRLVFYSIINENSWEIEPRYMSPIFGMLTVSAVCFFSVIMGAVRKSNNQNRIG